MSGFTELTGQNILITRKNAKKLERFIADAVKISTQESTWDYVLYMPDNKSKIGVVLVQDVCMDCWSIEPGRNETRLFRVISERRTQKLKNKIISKIKDLDYLAKFNAWSQIKTVKTR